MSSGHLDVNGISCACANRSGPSKKRMRRRIAGKRPYIPELQNFKHVCVFAASSRDVNNGSMSGTICRYATVTLAVCLSPLGIVILEVCLIIIYGQLVESQCPLLSSLMTSYCNVSELQVPLENETVFLGGEAHFFCQVLGKSENLRIRVNGGRILPPHRDTHNGVYITNNSSTMNSLTVSAINIRIEARKANNNSVVECYDYTMGRENAPTATVTVKGKHYVSFINIDI